jgi:alpha-D-xyloside xylohydrolase
MVRPLALVDPTSPVAWSNWWTYLYGSDILVSPIWEKGKRSQSVTLPSGSRWRDAWHPGKTYPGGQTIEVAAELHQIPLFVRDGSSVSLGDLEREYAEARAVAGLRPDLKSLDGEVRRWFEAHRAPTPAGR